jgi:poly(A) polymerase
MERLKVRPGVKDLAQHPVLRELIKVAKARNWQLFLVGGAIRDHLIKPSDRVSNFDLLLIGNLNEFAQECAAILHSRVVEVNPAFKTVLIPVGDVQVEISSPRDFKNKASAPIDISADPLTRDLLLRDFTFNAMALPLAPDHGEVFDPSHGQIDLPAKLVRSPISARVTIAEDPLRILRAVRFASLYQFAIDPELLQEMHNQRDSLNAVSVERRTTELLKILQSPKPSIGFKLLFITGVLDVVAPEIAALAHLKQNRGTRHKDIFEHTLKVLDGVAEADGSLETRLAALLHDIGKPATRQYDSLLGWTFHGHEVVGERMSERITAAWKLPNATSERVAKFVRLHMRPINLSDEGVTDSAVRRLNFQAGEDIDELIKLCRADVTSADQRKVKTYLQNFERVVSHIQDVEEKDQMRSFQSPVRGEVIMTETGLLPGPVIGTLKKLIEAAIIDGVIPNEFEAALNYLRQIKDGVIAEIGGAKSTN